MEINLEIVKKIFANINVKPTRVEFLAEGNNNSNYRVYSSKGDFVLRIELGLQFNNLEKEYNFLKKFSGFGPKVFYFDSSRNLIPKAFLIEEFIKGKHIDIIDSNFLKIAGKWYKNLHSNTNSDNSRYSTDKYFFDLEEFFKNPAFSRYLEFRNILNEEWEEKLTRCFENAYEISKNYKSLFEKLNQLSLTHGDPSNRNIFYSNRNIKFIDWEFAEYNLPESELSFFIWTHNLNKSQKDIFLKSYGYSFSKTSLKRLKIAYLIHILSIISWRVQRIDLIYKNRIPGGTYLSTKESIYREIENDLPVLNKLIKSFS